MALVAALAKSGEEDWVKQLVSNNGFKGLVALFDYFLTVVIFAVLSCGKSKMVMPKLSNPHQIKYRKLYYFFCGFLHFCKEGLLAEYPRKDVIKP